MLDPRALAMRLDGSCRQGRTKAAMGSRQAPFSAKIARRTPFQSVTVNPAMLLAYIGRFRGDCMHNSIYAVSSPRRCRQ
jgi:hypothetical protein